MLSPEIVLAVLGIITAAISGFFKLLHDTHERHKADIRDIADRHKGEMTAIIERAEKREERTLDVLGATAEALVTMRMAIENVASVSSLEDQLKRLEERLK